MKGFLIMDKTDVACKLTAISSRLALIGNFLETIQHDHTTKEDWAVIYTLFNRDGLENLANSLDDIREQVQILSDNLIEMDEVESHANSAK